jgi:hypothetical protein
MTQTKAAIVGTAPTWRKVPWHDLSMRIIGLNDAYVLGFPRVDEWYELHPFDKYVYRKHSQKVMRASDVPPGHYVRPDGHVEWLKQQATAINIWLQHDPPAGWPVNAQRLPVEALEAKYGSYWASGPAYELMHLYERGFREFHIYGIHLSTDHERIEQRHNFEFLLGRLLGPEVALSVEKGMRTYRGKECAVVLPVESPILQHPWRYAYDPKPQAPPDPYAAEWKAVQQEKQALIRALVQNEARDRKAALDRLARVEVIELDIQQERGRRNRGGTLTAAFAG